MPARAEPDQVSTDVAEALSATSSAQRYRTDECVPARDWLTFNKMSMELICGRCRVTSALYLRHVAHYSGIWRYPCIKCIQVGGQISACLQAPARSTVVNYVHAFTSDSGR